MSLNIETVDGEPVLCKTCRHWIASFPAAIIAACARKRADMMDWETCRQWESKSKGLKDFSNKTTERAMANDKG